MLAGALNACLGSRFSPQRMGVRAAPGSVQLWHRAHKGALELPTLQLADARMARNPTVGCQAPNQEAQAALAHEQPAPWQYIVALATVAIFICYADRSNISVAILEMAQQFGWDESFKGTVLGIFFLGYAGTQLVGGALADRYGGKVVLASGVLAWSAFTFLTPDAALAGSATLIACRIAMGLGEGIAFPAVHSIISVAVPKGYQSTAVAVVTAASYAGVAVAAGAAPWIIEEYSWPFVFYVFGLSAVLWLPFWLQATVPSGHVLPDSIDAVSLSARNDVESLDSPGGLARGGPTQNEPQANAAAGASSTQEEEDALLDASGQVAAEAKVLGSAFGLDRAFWGLVRRKPVWAICVTQYCQSWGMYALFNWLPTFFNEQYGVDVKDLGKYTLLPYVVQAAVGGLSGFAADSLVERGVSIKTTRRALQVTGMLGPAACLVVAVSPELAGSPALASGLITTAQGLGALTLGAVSVSQLDIAPKHAGAIFGLGNTFATVAGLLSVRLTGDILDGTGHSWSAVFAVTAAHYVVGAAVWCVWVGSERLPEDDW